MSLQTIFKHLDQSTEVESKVLSQLNVPSYAWEGIIKCYYTFN